MTGDVVAIRQPDEPLDPIDVTELIVGHQLMQPFGMERSTAAINKTREAILIRFRCFRYPIGTPPRRR